jgi:uncharacterized protein
MKRRTLLKIFGGTGLVALGADAIFLEPNHLVISRHHLRPPTPQPQTKPATLKIVQITDLHIKQINQFTRQVAATVARLNPDVILLTGDILDRAYTLPILAEFLALLPTQPRKYAILGNWENHALRDLRPLRQTYARYGCELLINQSATFQFGGREILLTGLDDTVEGRPDLVQALQGVEPQANHLLLAHAPDQRDRFTLPERSLLNQFQPQFMLSGHTHGGQVTLLGFAPILPRGSGRYIKGWYDDFSPKLYISRGLGSSGPRVRLGARPELAVFEWELV